MKTETVFHDIPYDHIIAERPRYYARQLMTPDDLTLEQDYFRARLRRHNLFLHGWGVVCGAQVGLVPEKADKQNGKGFKPWVVMIKPGYILGPYGDEITLDCSRIVDLRTQGVTGMVGEPCVETPDPWCSEVFEPRQTNKLYVAVRYKEVQARPVRVQPVGCGCDDTRCENSRWRDGYEIRILTHCPDSHSNPPDAESLIKGPIPACPPCSDEPWVVLAKVELEDDGKIMIDNCFCRRLVGSLGHFWWQCTEGERGVEGHEREQQKGEPDQLDPAKDESAAITASEESASSLPRVPVAQPRKQVQRTRQTKREK